MSLYVDTDDWCRECIQLHKSQGICPIIATYIISFYATPSMLLIVGEGEMHNSRRADSYGS